jgi:hypothetical protein
LELFVNSLFTNLPPGDVTRQAKSSSLQNRLKIKAVFSKSSSTKGHSHHFHSNLIVWKYTLPFKSLGSLRNVLVFKRRTCEASVSQTRHSNVLVLLLSCAPGPPTPLSILVRASLRCSVKGVVQSIVRDLQFLANFSHGIAFISQNKSRLTSFRRKVFVS